MRANAGLLLLLGLLLIAGAVSAYVADSTSTISTGNAWPVANGADTAVISVTAHNASGGNVPLAAVSFSLADASYGTLNPITATTDASGVATTTLTTKTKSGTAIIDATISSSDGMGSLVVPLSFNQDIDHDLAQRASFNNPLNMTVASNLTFVVTVLDRHGNPVDNRNPAEVHSFKLYVSDGGGRGFWDGSDYTLNTTAPPLETDALGQAAIGLRIANFSTRNMIYMQKFGGMSHNEETYIDGVAIQDPAYLVIDDQKPTQAIADGSEYFQLNYHVYDTLMNPINGTPIRVNASDGMFIDKDTVNGLIYLEYGPKTEAQLNTITLTSLNTSMVCMRAGTTVTIPCQQTVMFVNGGPVDIILTGSPQNLISRDQASGTKEATVRAVIVDNNGNPVDGQVVNFSFVVETSPPYRLSDGGPYNESIAPSLTTIRSGSSLVNTTAGGAASAFFSSGGFVTSGPGYEGAATGNATVSATWNGTTRSVRFTWKNYPSLSVKLPDNLCKDAHVGDTIDMGMEVVGDGAALQPNPIDAMLVMDRSGSMDGSMDGHTRLYWAKQAGMTFVNEMDPSRDEVGLTSFSSDTTLDYPLSGSFTDVVTHINGMTASGYTGTRNALKTSIEAFPAYDPSDKSVRAIILMTDGEFNYYADPLARWNATSSYSFSSTYTNRYTFFSGLPSPAGSSTATFGADKFTNQNMSEYALSRNIRIYTVSVSPDMSPGSNTWIVMDNLANSTGGKHFHADTGSALTSIYQQIAGELIEKAAGDAQIRLDFTNARDAWGNKINVSEYMQYQYATGISSHVKMVNATTTIYDYTQNDADNWTKNYLSPLLYFKAGEINLNDKWTVNYRVLLTKSGNVRLFGSGDSLSSVCYIDVKTNKTTCTSVEEVNCPVLQDLGGGFSEGKVDIADLTVTADPTNPRIVKVRWTTDYTGKYVCAQDLSYQNKNNPGKGYTAVYTTTDQEIPVGTPVVDQPHQHTIDMTGWPAGTYYLRVYGSDGKVQDSAETQWVISDTGSTVYLKLE